MIACCGQICYLSVFNDVFELWTNFMFWTFWFGNFGFGFVFMLEVLYFYVFC